MQLHDDSRGEFVAGRFRRQALNNRDFLRPFGNPVDTHLWSLALVSRLLLYPGRLWDRTADSWQIRRGRRIPVIVQSQLSDCGLACLAMMFTFFGIDVSVSQLREEMGSGRDGVSARALLEAARRRGIAGRGVRATVEGLRHLQPGSILFWNFNHFVVLERVGRESAVIADPAFGRRRVSLDFVGKCFTGVALEFQPPLQRRYAGPWTKRMRVPDYWRYLRYFFPKSRLWIPLSIASFLLLPFNVLVAISTDYVVEHVRPGHPLAVSDQMAITLAALIASYLALQIGRGLAIAAMQALGDKVATLGIMQRLVELPYNFFSTHSAGDLALRVRTSTTVRQALTSSTFSATTDGVLILAYSPLLLLADVRLTLVVMALAMLQVLVLLVAWSRQHFLVADALECQARAQGELVEFLEGMPTLKSAGLDGVASERWSHTLAEEINTRTRSRRNGAMWSGLSTCLQFSAPVVVLIVGANWVGPGLSLGKVIGFTVLSMSLLVPLGTLVQAAFQLAGLGASLARLGDIIEAEPENLSEPPLAVRDGAVGVVNVGFQYHVHGEQILHDVTFSVSPGSLVVVLGRSGSGKSTLATLLAGLYLPSQGEVLIDGVPTCAVDRAALRRSIGFVNQDARLFAGTIRDNIAWGMFEVTNQQVSEATELAEIRREIKALPMRDQTLLATGGIGLSGGQRQRVVLARALIRKPRLLILDEATSAIDPQTERRIFENLVGIGCTLVVIAHRLTAIDLADDIVVLEDGRVVRHGSYADLRADQNLLVKLVK